jgi:hypothetical protein
MKPMTTAAEYRARAEECLEWALNAKNESSRRTYIRWAELWLESALRAERLAALQERVSKEPIPTEPIPTAEYVWQLPPFQDWPRKSTRFNEIIQTNAARSLIIGANALSGYHSWLNRRFLRHQPQTPTAAIGMGLYQVLCLSTRERRRQGDQFFALLSRIRVLGPLRVQEKLFSRIHKLVAAGQVRPMMRNPQINSL